MANIENKNNANTLARHIRRIENKAIMYYRLQRLKMAEEIKTIWEKDIAEEAIKLTSSLNESSKSLVSLMNAFKSLSKKTRNKSYSIQNRSGNGKVVFDRSKFEKRKF